MFSAKWLITNMHPCLRVVYVGTAYRARTTKTESRSIRRRWVYSLYIIQHIKHISKYTATLVVARYATRRVCCKALSFTTKLLLPTVWHSTPHSSGTLNLFHTSFNVTDIHLCSQSTNFISNYVTPSVSAKMWLPMTPYLHSPRPICLYNFYQMYIMAGSTV